MGLAQLSLCWDAAALLLPLPLPPARPGEARHNLLRQRPAARAAGAPGGPLGAPTPASSSTRLEALRAVADQYAATAAAPRTRAARAANWSAFENWCAKHGLRGPPAELADYR